VGLLLRAVGLATVAAVAALALGHRASLGVAILVAISVTWIVARATFVRLAHGAFRAGRWQRSSLLYGIARQLFWRSAARAATRVSQAACATAAGDYERALLLLERLPSKALDDATRAAWLNNRAYASARLGRELDDALANVDEALRLRPSLPSFHHTRGVVLLALGRADQAVRELDEVWAASDEVASGLESERCFDLGVAWRAIGEEEYAADYFERAVRADPASRWASRAQGALGRVSATRASSVVMA